MSRFTLYLRVSNSQKGILIVLFEYPKRIAKMVIFKVPFVIVITTMSVP